MSMLLIALVVVLGVVIVVAWMVNSGGYEMKRRALKREADMKTLKNSLDMVFLQDNGYPRYNGCITGQDELTKALIDKGVLRGGALVADPLYQSDEEGCYYYVGVGGTYDIRFSTEKKDAQGNPIYMHVLP